MSPSSDQPSPATARGALRRSGTRTRRVHPDDSTWLKGSGRFPEEPLLLRWYRKEGALIWTEQRNKPIYDRAGNVIAIGAIARDVTGRKHAEEGAEQE